MSEVRRFRAMGCDAVVAGDADGAVRAVLERWERVFSRFRPDSELSCVNASTEWMVRVSFLFARALGVALAAARSTGGLVDPTLGAALQAAGYDRDYAELGDDPEPPGAPVPSRLGEIRLLGLLVWRPPGLQLDLNGVVKALAVDEAAAVLAGPGFVCLGGDLAVRGPVDVGLPAGGAVRVVAGGLATSGAATRRWRRGGAEHHHLIDPRTGRPAAVRWQQVTASGASCLAADLAAKTGFLLDGDGPDWLDDRGIPGRFVADDGTVVTNAAWARSLDREAACT